MPISFKPLFSRKPQGESVYKKSTLVGYTMNTSGVGSHVSVILPAKNNYGLHAPCY